MTDGNSLDEIHKIETEKSKYASDVMKLDYMTDFIKTVSNKKLLLLTESVDRSGTISKFASILKDIETAFKIEAGLFEFTVVYCLTNNYIPEMLSAVYNDKAHDLLNNLDETNSINNKTLVKAINDNVINAQVLAFLKPHELCPDRWKDIIKKNTLRDEKKRNMATTDLYQCWKCKERKCRVVELQTRSIAV